MSDLFTTRRNLLAGGAAWLTAACRGHALPFCDDGWSEYFSLGKELLWINSTASPLTIDFGTNQLPPVVYR